MRDVPWQGADQLACGVLVASRQGVIEYVNPRFTEVTGYPSEELLGQNPRILSSGVHTQAFYKDLWETLLSGHPWRGDVCNRKRNGELYWQWAILSPFRNKAGEITHFVEILEDISEQKRADLARRNHQAALERSNTALKQSRRAALNLMQDAHLSRTQAETALAQAAQAQRALEKAKQAAEEANQSKSRFLAKISHEIRTPMTAILGYAELLKQDDTLSKQQIEYLQTISRSGDHLLALISDILHMSKIEAAQVTLNDTDFWPRAVLQDYHAMFALRLQEKQLPLRIHVDAQVPETIKADKQKFKQIIVNLVSNAIKFTEHGSIEVALSRLPEHEHSYRLTTKDTGVGMSEKDQAAVLEPFVQGEAALTRGGTGLGLSICSEFARIMKGEITIHSTLGVGTQVSVMFQAAAGSGSPALSTGVIKSSVKQENAQVLTQDSLKQAMSELPPELLRQLASAVEGGFVDAISRCIEQIQVNNEELGRHLGRLAADFSYSRLQELISP